MGEGGKGQSRWSAAVGQALPLVLSAVLTLAVYAGSLDAGFMLDDPMDLPRASGRSFTEIFTSAGESSYFRPISLAIWKLAYVLLGSHDPVVLHLLVLVTHALNGWFVYKLGRRLTDAAGGLLALAFFGWFPLSYQVVSIVNAFFHALMTALVLGAVLLYWDARLHPSPTAARWRLVLAIAAGALAMLTHENGLAGIAIIVGAECVLRLRRRVVRWSLAPVFFAAAGIAFLALYWLVPRWQTTWTLDPASLRQNGLYFLQGLVYPVAGELANFSPGWGDNDGQALILASLATLAPLSLCLVIRRRLASLLIGLIWYIAGVAPAAIVLQWNYINDGPRLFYLASVGAALLWSAALAPSIAGLTTVRVGITRLRRVPQAIGFTIALVILGTSAQFITERGKLQLQGAAVVTQLADTATQPGPEAGRTYINVPSWLAFRTQGYLLGTTGVTMIPQYIGLGRSVYIHQGEQPEITSLSYPPVAGEWEQYYGFHGEPVDAETLERALRKGGGTYLTYFESGRIAIQYVGRVEAESPPSDGHIAQFGDWALLERAVVGLKGNDVTVDLVWRSLRKAPGSYTVFVHLIGATPEPVAQSDGDPIGGLFAAQRWLPGDRIYDHRMVPNPTEGTGEVTKVLVGLYDRESGERAVALGADGRHYRYDAVTLDVPVETHG